MKESGETVPEKKDNNPSRRKILTGAASLTALVGLPTQSGATRHPTHEHDMNEIREQADAAARHEAELKKYDAFMLRHRKFFTAILRPAFTPREIDEPGGLFESVANYVGTQLILHTEVSFLEALTKPRAVDEIYAVLAFATRRIKNNPDMEDTHPALLKVKDVAIAIVKKAQLELKEESQKK